MSLFYLPQPHETDSNGDPLNGGQLFFYEPGTTNAKTVYQDKALTVAHANPVVADASGRWDPIYLDGTYKVVLQDANNVTIWTEDDISVGASGDIFGETESLTVTTSIDSTYQNKHIRCTNTINLNLLAISTAGEGFAFSVRNDGTGIVTIDPNASEQINDATTILLSPGDSGICIAGTAEWSYIGLEAQKHWAKGADVASANALTLGTDGNYFDITGTTSITSIGSLGIGTVIKLHFDAALTLTHNATDLILPNGANITTAAGDEAELIEYASGDWILINYQRNEDFDYWPVLIEAPDDLTYDIIVNVPHGGEITSVTSKSASGTCTGTVRINDVALGGTANSVSSTEQEQAHSSSNVFASGDDIDITISSNSSCVRASFTIKFKRYI